MCKYLSITRSAYYHWLKHPKSNNELQNEMLSIEIQKIHKQHPDMGYRRIRDELEGHKGIHVNDKRVLRICRKCDIKSNIKWKPKSCTRGDRNPDHIAKNYLHRDFHANKPNEKWLTDVSEFKYYNGIEVHKVYLSAILDLYDRRIVAFKISDHNDNPIYAYFYIYPLCSFPPYRKKLIIFRKFSLNIRLKFKEGNEVYDPTLNRP